MLLKRIASVLLPALLLAACASAPKPPPPVAVEEHLKDVPAEFLVAYPQGSQARDLAELRRTMESRRAELDEVYRRFFDEGLRAVGMMRVSVALKPDGTVTAVGLASSDLESPKFEQAVMLKIGRIRFGPVPGEGLYVFSYPLHFGTLR
ncbi:MAG: hypothetical protein ACREVL_01735 [Solimonas sp.]